MSPRLIRLVPAVLAALLLPSSLPAQGRGGGSGSGNGTGGTASGSSGGGSHGGGVSARGSTSPSGARSSASSGASVSRGSSPASRGVVSSGRPGISERRYSGSGGLDSAYGNGTSYNGAYALPSGAYPNGARSRNGYVWRSTRGDYPYGYPFSSYARGPYARGGYYPFGGYGYGYGDGGYSSDSDTTPRPTQEPGGFSGVLSSNDSDGPRRPAPAESRSMLAAPAPSRWPRPASYPGEVAGKPEVSAVVLEAQQKLAQRGYYAGPSDGNFSADTSLAVASFQSDAGMPITGRIDNRILDLLRR